MKYDLHIHSTYSDGLLTIDQIVAEAIKKGLDGIAITDHDDIKSWEEIKSHTYPIQVFSGVEISTKYKGDTVHVLGYHLNCNEDYQELTDTFDNIKERRKERVRKIIEKLKQFDIYITYDEIMKHVDGAVARPHIANTILEKYPNRGYTFNSLFEDYLGAEKPAFVEIEHYDASDAIKLLHRNHCLAVIAHPWMITKFDFREMLTLGIDGVECDMTNQIENSNIYLTFAKENHLIITSGSDYHGPNIFSDMGTNYIEKDYIDSLLNRLNSIDIMK